MDTQVMIVYVLFTAAVFWLGLRFYKTYNLKKEKQQSNGKSCGSDRCDCN